MSKKFLRMLFLVRTILKENGKLTVEEILEKVEKQFSAYTDIQKLRMDEYSVSTFNKDKKAIRDEWKIDLECDSKGRYAININFESAFQNDLMNSAIFLSSLNADMLLPGFVLPETRKNTGLEYFHTISEAIENHFEITFSYFDYISELEKVKTVQPYFLKQKDFKWYVLATEGGSQIPFKSYALERIREIEIGKKFRPKKIDFEEPYKNAIGMFTNETAERIVLQYDHRDGHYLKANPIHHSQKMILEDDKTITFEIFAKPNEDLQMELMKRSWSVKIIEPTSLREKMLEIWKEVLERNKV